MSQCLVQFDALLFFEERVKNERKGGIASAFFPRVDTTY
jgi:hypothetical protein